MSEITATRIARAGTLLVLAGLWLAAAVLLWRMRVPADLKLPHLDPRTVFSEDELQRSARHARALRLEWLGQTAAQLIALAALAGRGRRLVERLAPSRALSSALVAAVTYAAFVAAGLPFAALAERTDRNAGISRLSWVDWVSGQAQSLLVGLVVAAAVGVALVALARRLRQHWWIGGATGFVVAVALVVTLGPLAAGTKRIDGARYGLAGVHVEVASVHDETRSANAEAVGVGPTARVILWDTLLRFRVSEVRFVAAHERAHVARRHVLKGLAWLALAAFPGFWLLARVARPHDPAQLPRAIFAFAVLALCMLPLGNVVARRYEAEADWLALTRTRDPAAAARAFHDLAATSLAQPKPPRWAVVLFGDHPPTIDRIEMARAYALRR
jgi:STE24 endopeptidase